MKMVALKCLNCHFVKRLALQNINANCFAVINNGVMVLNLKSVVPIKTRFVHGKRHSALHICLVMMSTSNTTSLCNQNPTAPLPNGFKLISKFYLSQISSLWNFYYREFSISTVVRSDHLTVLKLNAFSQKREVNAKNIIFLVSLSCYENLILYSLFFEGATYPYISFIRLSI